jgi:phage terminase large subunit-like protein
MLDPSKRRQYAADPMAFFEDLVIPSAHGPRRFGDCMAGFQRERFATLAPALLAVSRGERPPIGRHWWEATKGASKDSDLACAMLWLLCFSRRPLTCQVGAADADQAAELRKAAKDVVNLNPMLSARVDVQTWKLVCDATKSACEIISADVGGSHGARPDVLIINELSHIGKQEFAENLRDNAAKVPGGLAIVATNAGFDGTWQHRWRELARELSTGDSPRWSFHAYSQPAPWLDEAEIDEARRRNSRSRFDRLWQGIWASGTGDALDADDITAAIVHNLPPLYPGEPGYGFIGGMDLGTRHDHSALCILAMHLPTQRLRLAHIQSWAPGPDGQIDLIDVQATALDLARTYCGCGFIYDPHQAELMAQQLRLKGVPMQPVPFVRKNLDLMANTLLQTFRSRQIDLFPDPELIRDLGRLSIVERGFGYKLEAPKDKKAGHCDKAFALAIALPFANEAMSRVPPAMGAQPVLDHFDFDMLLSMRRNGII